VQLAEDRMSTTWLQTYGSLTLHAIRWLRCLCVLGWCLVSNQRTCPSCRLNPTTRVIANSVITQNIVRGGDWICVTSADCEISTAPEGFQRRSHTSAGRRNRFNLEAGDMIHGHPQTAQAHPVPKPTACRWRCIDEGWGVEVWLSPASLPCAVTQR
jgi:hypothetical protein